MKQNELQTIRSLVKNELMMLQNDKAGLKNFINTCWEKANPNTNKGKYYFRLLNMQKYKLSKINDRIRVLSKLTKSIKKEMQNLSATDKLFPKGHP